MIYSCCDDRRRTGVIDSALNGIDFLEVLDDPALPNDQRQRKLFVHLLKPLAVPLTPQNVRIEGGERITDVGIKSVSLDVTKQILTVEVTKPGDFSTYTLRLVNAANPADPPDGFDVLAASVAFSFKVECPSDFDCKPVHICPPASVTEPEIDYLSKDYASFRQLMLDRMSLLMPQWTERHPSDSGIALVELLAYVGDSLSYQQDAVATEAYLATSRRRVSIRRHARLVDYHMHDGSNARVWIRINVNANNVKINPGTRFLTMVPGRPARLPVNSPAYFEALGQQPEVFEAMSPATLFQAHFEMPFYTWGARQCCLPKGATSATLRGNFTNLKAGMVLVLAEVVGPLTGAPGDADRSHRQAVMLQSVTFGQDKIGGEFNDPPDKNPVLVTEIAWSEADALTFPLCISSLVGTTYIPDVSMAWGNVVLADHGLSNDTAEDLGAVPQPFLTHLPDPSADRCQPQPPSPIPPRYRPLLQRSPLTQATPFDILNPPTSAAQAMTWAASDTIPSITLTSTEGTDVRKWHPLRDLLRASPSAENFVVEIEGDGRAFIRFGDDKFGLRPPSGTTFTASYRIGNGVAGNIGAESIGHVVSNDTGLLSASNPLPAHGGLEPESSERVRQDAPSAFRSQERAVTAADYAAVAERDPDIERAVASFRWTGSWYTVFLQVERVSGKTVDAAFKQSLADRLDLFRMAGHDLEIEGPIYVPIEIEVFVCAKPDYFSSDVEAALFDVFSNRILPDDRRGYFFPDNFTFGQPVYLSQIYAAAQEVDGVASVAVNIFQRQGNPNSSGIAAGKIDIQRSEIARLSNDPNFPDRGVFRLTVKGGK
jgi:hypothetical protein